MPGPSQVPGLLAAAWAQCLGEQPTPASEFYLVGGDSLTAVGIATAVAGQLTQFPDLDVFLITEILEPQDYASLERALVEYVSADLP